MLVHCLVPIFVIAGTNNSRKAQSESTCHIVYAGQQLASANFENDRLRQIFDDEVGPLGEARAPFTPNDSLRKARIKLLQVVSQKVAKGAELLHRVTLPDFAEG